MSTSHRWDVSPEFWNDDQSQSIEQARQIRMYRRAIREQHLAQPPGLPTYAVTMTLMSAAFAFVVLAFGG